MTTLRFLRALFLVSFATSFVSSAEPARLKIVLVGDSTVTDNAGWGLGFKQFIDPARAEVINTAKGGRSSMSFIKEDRWKKALELKGDYYLIQFGHNDEPGKPGRSTTLDEYRDYMNRYVDEARAAGAKPVLVTSLVRRQFDKSDPHKINSSLAGHVAIVKEIAAAKNVPLIDLHARSKALCEKLGRDGCLVFSPMKKSGEKTVPDGTHLNDQGYVLFGNLVAEELKAAVPELASSILASPLDSHPKPADPKAESEIPAGE
ncbi:MAG: rhamnogalacturonan acetylesterase [Nibricoccus sp.]